MFAIPCFAILAVGWTIVTNLGNNKSFIEANVKKFKIVSKISLFDGIFFFCGKRCPLAYGVQPSRSSDFSLIISFVLVVLSVIMDTLAFLVDNATQLQIQSDLTIYGRKLYE